MKARTSPRVKSAFVWRKCSVKSEKQEADQKCVLLLHRMVLYAKPDLQKGHMFLGFHRPALLRKIYTPNAGINVYLFTYR